MKDLRGVFDSSGKSIIKTEGKFTAEFLEKVIKELEGEFKSDSFINISVSLELEFNLMEALENCRIGNLGTGRHPTNKPSWFSPFTKTSPLGTPNTVDTVRLTKLNIITHNFLPPNVWFISNGIKMIIFSHPFEHETKGV